MSFLILNKQKTNFQIVSKPLLFNMKFCRFKLNYTTNNNLLNFSRLLFTTKIGTDYDQ